MPVQFIVTILSLLFGSFAIYAQTEHTLIRRVSVFPIRAPQEMRPIAEEAWWELRDAMTKNKRFLVASKNFLQQKDVYQSRAELSPADAIILGKLLDANALVTTSVEDRTLVMRVYEGDYGRPLWIKQLVLQPSLPISAQIKPSVIKLAKDFIASIPYHGFVVTDPLQGRPIYQEGRRLLLKADVGLDAEIEVGDTAQLIRIYSDTLKPMFVDGATSEIYGEGRVVAISREIITVELDRLNRSAQILDGALLRLPKELKRLQQTYAIQDGLRSKIDPEFFSPGMTSAKQAQSETKPLIASLTFIANLAAFLLLAF